MPDLNALKVEARVAHQKPLPMESIHKHLAMLHNYCQAMSTTDPVKARAKAYGQLAVKLEQLVRSRAVSTLLTHGD